MTIEGFTILYSICAIYSLFGYILSENLRYIERAYFNEIYREDPEACNREMQREIDLGGILPSWFYEFSSKGR